MKSLRIFSIFFGIFYFFLPLYNFRAIGGMKFVHPLPEFGSSAMYLLNSEILASIESI